MRASLLLVLAAILFFGCLSQPNVENGMHNDTTSPTATAEPQENATPPQQPDIAQTPKKTPFEEANDTAYAFARYSSTYAYDGSGLHPAWVNGTTNASVFAFEFTSGFSGFGNRSAYQLDAMETPHSLEVSVGNGNITAAILDGIYDELKGEWIDRAKTADLAPTDKERSRQIAMEFIRTTEDYLANASPNADVWTNDYYSDRISDTAYVFWVSYNTSRSGNYYERVWSERITVNRYVPILHNKTLVQKEWVDWYSDPTTDYSKITQYIPDPKCPDGQLIAANLTYKFCYPPSATHNTPCSKSESCDRGACIRTSMGEFGPPAKCMDYPFGCRYWLFEDGYPVNVCLD